MKEAVYFRGSVVSLGRAGLAPNLFWVITQAGPATVLKTDGRAKSMLEFDSIIHPPI